MSLKQGQVTRAEIICDNCGVAIPVNMGATYETVRNDDGSISHYCVKNVSGALANCKNKKMAQDELIKIRKEQNLQPTDVIGTDHYDKEPILRSDESSVFKSNDGNTYRNISTYRQETEDGVTGQDTSAVRNLQREQEEQLTKKRKQIAESFGMSEQEFRDAWR